ncbi:MAG: (deoxy)nucleoside triphosphate pyrophosphohydrolase [Planctomycetota bacterium]|nr:(deoxy)nucleoside triphosphate pyrophosphohydrolase [Planctomycetota bacterium]MDA1211654.1 (deoxy)nucleoside triphosphate pyrophosphohydrolase [Planctomycetota bacterium]
MTVPTRIGIAIVECDGRFLVGERGAESSLAGCAEFPGGKCHPGESSDAAARRECLEETGIDVAAIELIDERLFSYPHGDVQLHFWRCRLQLPSIDSKPLNGFRWVSLSTLRQLPFPEGNDHVLEKLIAPASNTVT